MKKVFLSILAVVIALLLTVSVFAQEFVPSIEKGDEGDEQDQSGDISGEGTIIDNPEETSPQTGADLTIYVAGIAVVLVGCAALVALRAKKRA